MSNNQLPSLIRRLFEARAIEEEAERCLDEARRTLAQIEAAVAKGMVDEGVQNVTIDGHQVYLSTRLYCNRKAGVTPADVVAIAHDLDLDDLIETAVQPARLKAFVREGLAAARESAPAATPCEVIDRRLLAAFDVVELPSVNVRKAASN